MKDGTPAHPKVKDLARRLQIPRYAAVGILEMLWHFASRSAPCGDIGKHPDYRIADAVDWPLERKPEELIDALVESGWLDRHPKHGLVVHDWAEHCDDGTHARVARARQWFIDGTVPRLRGLKSTEREPARQFYESPSSGSPVVGSVDQPQKSPGPLSSPVDDARRPAEPSLAKPSLAKPSHSVSDGEDSPGLEEAPPPLSTPTHATPGAIAKAREYLQGYARLHRWEIPFDDVKRPDDKLIRHVLAQCHGDPELLGAALARAAKAGKGMGDKGTWGYIASVIPAMVGGELAERESRKGLRAAG